MFCAGWMHLETSEWYRSIAKVSLLSSRSSSIVAFTVLLVIVVLLLLLRGLGHCCCRSSSSLRRLRLRIVLILVNLVFAYEG